MTNRTTIIWTNPGYCPPCSVTKSALDKRGVPYEVRNLEDYPEARASFKARGFMSAPVVDPVYGTPWAGYKLDRINELAALVNPPAPTVANDLQ